VTAPAEPASGAPNGRLYIGAAEAKMMIDERLFQSDGDVIKGLFGNDVIVAGVLPATGSPLDQMHFASADLKLPAQ